MSRKPRDPLLAVARFILSFAMVIAVAAAAAIVTLIPVVVFAQDWVIIKVAAASQAATPGLILAIVAVLAFFLTIVIAAFVFLRLLRRIVDSVALGDPFAPVNAVRLQQMAWIVVGFEVASIPMGGVAAILERATDNVRLDVGMSTGGILLAIVLFILARVFRTGAKMREDLEGTV